ncbi:hypothetical protein Ocin01_07173 [Orchesella cincta]|uniref:Uncharacterized protein n=1 Tax=Orchesella cincta TaxID=48709 RepID=A0A1D2N2L0_ORCCI|nr:hypothetical protein Ocin01_07173 [Orchesella cincta]
MKFSGNNCDIAFRVVVLISYCLTIHVVASAPSNIESGSDGGFCINKIPKRAVPGKCTDNFVCEDLLAIPHITEGSVRCGDQGECVTTQVPQNEYCKDACGSSACGKFCLQEHETKNALYCIETRDHPNAMPNGTVVTPNRYYCTCYTGHSKIRYWK